MQGYPTRSLKKAFTVIVPEDIAVNLIDTTGTGSFWRKGSNEQVGPQPRITDPIIFYENVIADDGAGVLQRDVFGVQGMATLPLDLHTISLRAFHDIALDEATNERLFAIGVTKVEAGAGADYDIAGKMQSQAVTLVNMPQVCWVPPCPRMRLFAIMR